MVNSYPENVDRNVLALLAASFDFGIIQFRNGYLLLVFATRRYSGLGRDESWHEGVIIHVACVIVVDWYIHGKFATVMRNG